MSELRWLRLWTDVVDDPKLLLLAPSDRWHYVAILALKRSGMLDEPDTDEVRDRKVGLRLRLDDRERDELRRRLIEVRLIDIAWQPMGWGGRQFSSDHDSTAAERQRRYRDNHRNALVTRDSNGEVTRPDTEQIQRQRQSRTEGEGSGEMRATRAAVAKRLPDDFELTPERRVYAEGEGIDAEREFGKFRDHWKASGGSTARKRDWDAAWRLWCRRAKDMAPRGTKPEWVPPKSIAQLEAEEAARGRK